MEESEIDEFYSNKSVFITGGTGFLGKVLIEKLLRSCPRIKQIYVLIRPNSSKSCKSRLNDLFNCEIFNIIKKDNPNLLSKVYPINGNITYPCLGINYDDLVHLKKEVNIVFHSAATIRFDEPLKKALEINLCGTEKVLSFCNELENLISFVHVSTAYCNTVKNQIEEAVYEHDVSVENILSANRWMNTELLESLSKKLYCGRPSSYHYTKALAESLVLRNCNKLEKKDKKYFCAIVRPSIVTPTIQDPFPGWTNNYYGPTGYLVVCGKGVLRSMLVHKNKICDIIPVDIVANTAITASYYITKNKNLNNDLNKKINNTEIQPENFSEKKSLEINSFDITNNKVTAKKKFIEKKNKFHDNENSQLVTVFNCISGSLNPISWGEIHSLCEPFLLKYPSIELFRYPGALLHSNKLLHQIILQVEHNIPAKLIDFVFKLLGHKPILTPVYDKVHRSIEALEHFTTNEWTWKTDNFQKLIDSQNEYDKKNFFIDVKQIDWEKYMEAYILGVRCFLLKEDPSTIPSARKKLNRLYYLTQIVKLGIAGGIMHQAITNYPTFKKYFLWISKNTKLNALK